MKQNHYNQSFEKNDIIYAATMKKVLLIILLFIFAIQSRSMPSFKDTIMVCSIVKDEFTGEVIGNAAIRVYDEQNNLIAQGKTSSQPSMNNNQLANFTLFIPRRNNTVVFKITADNYEDFSHTYQLKVGAREKYINISPIILKKKHKKIKEVKLDEVTVTTSKIKMVMHGDTIVYNADAFQLSNGSMLDELIRRLPGVQLKGNQITVNGKFVSSLLVNGSDFFKGDPAIALQNLPAYTVNKLKVYERKDDIAEFAQQKDIKGMAPLVMDVCLKRQYMQGMLANADLGMGTKDRWMSRLFALRYTKLSRIGIFANLNNINDERAPGTNGEWGTAQLENGTSIQKKVGADYLFNNKDRSFEFSGNTTFAHENTNQQSIVSSERFLQGGNTYGRSRNYGKETESWIMSMNSIKKNWTRTKLEILPQFTYYKNTTNNLVQSATLSVAPNEKYRGASLDSLFASPASKQLKEALLNQLSDHQLNRMRYYDGNLSGQIQWKMPQSPDGIILKTENRYFNKKNENASIYDLNYKNGVQDFRNKYNDKWNLNLRTIWDACYYYNGNIDYKYRFSAGLKYTHIYDKNNNDLFRLDKYAEYGGASNVGVGYLPSTRDSLQRAIDADNSFRSHINKDRYELTGNTPSIKLPVFGLHAFLSPGVNYRSERIDYTRGAYKKKMTRNLWSLEPTLFVGKENCHFTYNVKKVLPELTDILDITTTDNPLNLWSGNPNLKNTDIHRIDFFRGFYKYNENFTSRRAIEIKAYWQLMRNAIGQYVTYDRNTGVVHSTPMNINGNWDMGASFDFNGILDKKNRFTLSNRTEIGYINSVDYMAIEGESGKDPRSSVRTAKANETVSLDYSFGKYSFGAKLRCAYIHAEGSREDFKTINTADVDYGLNATLELPLKLRLFTDITLYSRYGYSDKSMNTNNLVWNARLERSFGKFTVMADGFDLLGKLSNVRKVINAQGRTETWYNTVPRYAMLHIMYKLHFKPKR